MKRIKPVGRLKNNKEPFSADTFYISYNKETDIYQLRDVETHFTVSTATSLELILVCLDKILRRYKNETIYKKKLFNMSEKENNSKTLEKKRKEFKKFGEKFRGAIEERVNLFLDGDDSKKIGKRIKPVIHVKEIEEKKEETVIVPKRIVKKKKKRLQKKLPSRK